MLDLENENIRAKRLVKVYDNAIITARKIRDNPTHYKGVTRKKAEIILEHFKEECFKKVQFEKTIFSNPRKATKNFVKAVQMAEKKLPIFAAPLKQIIKKTAPAWYYQACIDIQLDHLRTKVADLGNRGFKMEADTLSHLINLLEEKNELFFRRQAIDCKTFVSECQQLINAYKPKLYEHRGILKIIDAIVVILYCLIHALDLCSSINQYEEVEKQCNKTGGFFFTTKTFQRLEKLEKEIDAFDFTNYEFETSFSLRPGASQETSL